MNFSEIAIECIGNSELVKNFNRLTGCNIGVDKRVPIEKMIDEATGYQWGFEDMEKFIAFVFDCIWLSLIIKEQTK